MMNNKKITPTENKIHVNAEKQTIALKTGDSAEKKLSHIPVQTRGNKNEQPHVTLINE